MAWYYQLFNLLPPVTPVKLISWVHLNALFKHIHPQINGRERKRECSLTLLWPQFAFCWPPLLSI